MTQFICCKCEGNINSIGTKKGTTVSCRHCGKRNVTIEDNL